MTIIVVGDETFTTSLVPREQHEHEDHDADPTTEAHDFSKDVLAPNIQAQDSLQIGSAYTIGTRGVILRRSNLPFMQWHCWTFSVVLFFP